MASIRSYKKKGVKKDLYEYRIKYRDPVTGKPKEKSKRGFKSKKEAEIAAAEVEKQLMIGNVDEVLNSEITIKEWITQYLDLYSPRLRKTTLRTRTSRFDKHILPSLGHLKIQKISRVQYQKFINSKLESMSESTVKSLHGTFMMLINKAAEHGIIQTNKFKGIAIKKENEEDKLKFLNRDEVDLFLGSAKQFEYDEYISVLTLIRTGLRKGELLALTWGDINFEEKTIAINKNRNSQGTFPPKTKKSNRTISIDISLTNELKKFHVWQKENKLRHGKGYHESNYFIVDHYGVPYHEWKLNKIIWAITDNVNMPKIGPHALRHTHAVMLLESGVDIKTVSDRLGHTKINMTADVYLHVSRKQENEAVAKLEQYLK